MNVKIIAFKCPECNANLEVVEKRDFCFCQYCGAKIFLNDENEYIYRKIDDAAIKQIELDKFKEQHKYELDEENKKNKEKKKKNSILFLIISVILLAIGFAFYNCY